MLTIFFIVKTVPVYSMYLICLLGILYESTFLLSRENVQGQGLKIWILEQNLKNLS